MAVPDQTSVRKGSLLRTIQAVAWSFIGIRKNSAYQEDVARLNIVHIIAVAIAAVILLVLGLVALVHWVVQ
ncbi:MAG: DUF2970 domain-containing protein [Curvibacter sp.]|nr:DUF2970 domain-containing protein [Curvibacter sp.]